MDANEFAGVCVQSLNTIVGQGASTKLGVVMRARISLIPLLSVIIVCLLVVPLLWPEALAKKPDQESSPGRKVYELRTYSMGRDARAVRFKPETGQAWYFCPHWTGESWTMIQEPKKIPFGDYDVLFPDKDSEVFRIDRKEGTTWRLQEGRQPKWIKIDEPNK